MNKRQTIKEELTMDEFTKLKEEYGKFSEEEKAYYNNLRLEDYIKNTIERRYIDCQKGENYEFYYILSNLQKLADLQSIDKSNFN